MAVYVDALFEMEPRTAQARRHGNTWCHMFADTPDELHAFAKRLGLKESWAQDVGRPTLHYDLVPSKRTKALKLGAKETTTRAWLNRVRPGYKVPVRRATS